MSLNFVDKFLIILFPICIAVTQISLDKRDKNILLRLSALILAAIIIQLGLGLLIALYTWPSINPNELSLLPKSYKKKPFFFYWTIFIIPGIIIPIFYSYAFGCKPKYLTSIDPKK